jgi:peptidoglycan hydrolase-like protein with peptidoglycan-binding domain
MKHLNLYKAILLSTCLTISSHAYADERMQSLIGGIVGGIIQAIDENTTNSENITDNKSTISIQYSARVAEIQGYLKQLNIYKNSVDGLHGAGTQKAIDQWEDVAGLLDDGVISDAEIEVMRSDIASNTVYSEFVDTDGGDTNSSRKLAGSSIMDRGQKIQDFEYNHQNRKTMFDWCVNYRDKTGLFKRHGSNALAVFLDKEMSENYKKYERHYEKFIYKLGECVGFDKEQTNAFRSKGAVEYRNSTTYIMNQSGIAGVINGAMDEEEFVNNCNSTSQMFVSMVQNKLNTSNIKECQK